MANWEIKWTGCYPTLCFGEWIVKKDGEVIPSPFDADCDANTFGTYSRWYFVDWIEEFEDYEDGLEFNDWCNENKDWLETYADKKDYETVFKAFQAEDWRRGQCAGCV